MIHMAHLTRRSFVRGTASLVGLAAAPAVHASGRLFGFDQVRIGVVGIWNRGRANLVPMLGEQVVAICDVDRNYLGNALGEFKSRDLAAPKTYTDFRKLIEENELDGLVVATPDHVHAHPTLMGLDAGLALYCEKPLAHTVEEVRAIRAAAAKAKAPTQMGTQIHAGGNYRRVVELLRSGAIGQVREVHTVCGKTWSNGRYGETLPVPAHLDWDLWQGPIPSRDYVAGLHPASWRKFWAYGTGTLGDMACHHVDLVHWALDLGVPDKVQAFGPERHADGTPDAMHVAWEHAAKGERAAVTVHWYDGSARPEVPPELLRADGTNGSWGDGSVFVGDKGTLCADYGRYKLYPEADFAEFQAPEPSIQNSIGHHAEWIKAIRDGTPTTCDFTYSGNLSETVLLGNVAYRTGKQLVGCADGTLLEHTPEAAPYLSVKYREGWSL
ncbi:MAG: putative dehydrogenase [Planctomycetota bacterium]|jgi:predicted dehydrogenase